MSGRALPGWLGRLRGAVTRAGLELAERPQVDLGRHVHDLSRGNKQKLGVVPTLMHTPALALLDEPASSLDPASPSIR